MASFRFAQQVNSESIQVDTTKPSMNDHDKEIVTQWITIYKRFIIHILISTACHLQLVSMRDFMHHGCTLDDMRSLSLILEGGRETES